MKEIEILIETKDSKENILNVLGKYEQRGVHKTLDIYYYDPLREDLQPEDDLRLRRSFRLRQKGDKLSLAYKVDNFNEDDEWIYSDEHEVQVDSFEEMEKILNHLGFKELVRIDNEKHIFITNDYEVVFEDVKDLGYFLEVERIGEVKDNEVHVEKERIRSFIKDLNIELGKELNAGKPELMLRKSKPL